MSHAFRDEPTVVAMRPSFARRSDRHARRELMEKLALTLLVLMAIQAWIWTGAFLYLLERSAWRAVFGP